MIIYPNGRGHDQIIFQLPTKFLCGLEISWPPPSFLTLVFFATLHNGQKRLQKWQVPNTYISNYPPTCVGLNISKYVIKKLMMIIIHYITRQNQSIVTNIKSVVLEIYLYLQWICQMMDAKNMLCKARAERAFGGRKMSGSCSCSTRKIWATKIVGNLVLVMSCCYWILGWRFLEMSRKISIFFLHKNTFSQ